MLYLLFNCLNTKTHSSATRASKSIHSQKTSHFLSLQVYIGTSDKCNYFYFHLPKLQWGFSIKKYGNNREVYHYLPLLTLKRHLHRTSSTTHYSTKFTIDFVACCHKYETNTVSPTLETLPGGGRRQHQEEISR